MTMPLRFIAYAVIAAGALAILIMWAICIYDAFLATVRFCKRLPDTYRALYGRWTIYRLLRSIERSAARTEAHRA